MADLSTDRTHRLGSRAYFLFLGKGVLWFLLAVALLSLYWWYPAPYIPKNYIIFYDYSVKLFALFISAYGVFLLAKAYLEYRGHGYRFDDEFFHITKGYLNQHEVGVVYHQIQTVTVRRTLGARIVGVANLTIVTNSNREDNEIHLPGIDARKARLVQRELLSRAKSMHERPKKREYEPVAFEEDEEFEDE